MQRSKPPKAQQKARALAARIEARAAILEATEGLPDNANVGSEVAAPWFGYDSPDTFRAALRAGRVAVKPEPRSGRTITFKMGALRRAKAVAA